MPNPDRLSPKERRAAQQQRKTPPPPAAKPAKEQKQVAAKPEPVQQMVKEEPKVAPQQELNPILTDAKNLSDDAAKLVEGAVAIAKDAVKVATEAQHVVQEVVELATSHPDMCDPKIFGTFDPHSDYCKSCEQDAAECAAACKALTESRQVAPAAKAAGAAKPRAPRVKTGDLSLFSQSYLTQQNGMIDKSLESPKTVIQHAIDTKTSEPRVKSHIAWLVAHKADRCKKVVGADGKVHFELLPGVTAEKTATA